jgi:hypothetical protein
MKKTQEFSHFFCLDQGAIIMIKGCPIFFPLTVCLLLWMQIKSASDWKLNAVKFLALTHLRLMRLKRFYRKRKQYLQKNYGLSRNFYKGILGDKINVMLAAAAMNFKRIASVVCRMNLVGRVLLLVCPVMQQCEFRLL